ncbi:MAG: YolD-like family protein [Lachnospiraceae bacterium]|nr:YolD-like family protein [Lachnospiraceae bacterium]
MDRSERAKQFMPFAALKGFEELLAEKEKMIVPKIELSEERKAELDDKMRSIRKNDMITVTYYAQKEYLKMRGMVSGIDTNARYLKVVNTKIPFDDIYDITEERRNAFEKPADKDIY